MSLNLFKITAEDCDKNKVTVGDTNFKEHYPGVNRNMAWKTLEPFIRQATERYVFPYICEEALCELADKYQKAAVLKFKEDIITFVNGATLSFEEGTAVTIKEAKLMLMFQDIIAYYTIHLAMPVLNTIVADMGVQQNSSSDATSNPTQLWRYKNTRWEVCLVADAGMDRALSYIHKNLQGEDKLSDTWANCSIYEKSQTCFFKTVEQFQCFEDIKNSWRTFKALVPAINKAALRYIKPILCENFYQELCTQIAEDTLTDNNKAIVKLVRGALASYTLKDGIARISIVVESDGIKMVSSTDGMNIKATANDTAIQRLIEQATEDAEIYKQDLMNTLYANPDNYPTWRDSECCEIAEDEDDCKEDWHIGGIAI